MNSKLDFVVLKAQHMCEVDEEIEVQSQERDSDWERAVHKSERTHKMAPHCSQLNPLENINTMTTSLVPTQTTL